MGQSSNVIVQLVFMLFRRGVVLKLGRFSSCLSFHSLKYCFTTEILFFFFLSYLPEFSADKHLSSRRE